MSETAFKEVTAGFHRDRELFLKKDNKSIRPAGSFNFKAFFFGKRTKKFLPSFVNTLCRTHGTIMAWYGS